MQPERSNSNHTHSSSLPHEPITLAQGAHRTLRGGRGDCGWPQELWRTPLEARGVIRKRHLQTTGVYFLNSGAPRTNSDNEGGQIHFGLRGVYVSVARRSCDTSEIAKWSLSRKSPVYMLVKVLVQKSVITYLTRGQFTANRDTTQLLPVTSAVSA